MWIVVSPSISSSIDCVEDMMDHKVINPEWKGTIRAYTYGYLSSDNIQRIILFLRPTSKPGEIAHEIKHAINIIFSWNGIKLSTSNDESECYYLENLVDKTHNAITTYKRKQKKLNKINK